MTGIPNLESLETKTLHFLQEAERPLVSLRNLLRHLNAADAHAELSENALIEFLDAHELFCVAHPPEGAPEFIESAVYLATRVPSDLEMKAHMAVELDAMMKALEQAHKEASGSKDQDRADQIAALLDRAQQLRNHLATSK